jgi:hypothetical protein
VRQPAERAARTRPLFKEVDWDMTQEAASTLKSERGLRYITSIRGCISLLTYARCPVLADTSDRPSHASDRMLRSETSDNKLPRHRPTFRGRRRNVAESTISRGHLAPGSRHMPCAVHKLRHTTCAYYNGAAEYREVIAGPFLTSRSSAPWSCERVEPENLFGTATTPVRDHRPRESGCSG